MYDYQAFTYDLELIRRGKVFSIGKSFEGREIYCIRYGNGPKKIFVNGVHHALEWLTGALLMRYAAMLEENEPENSIFLVPIVNPDGVEKVKRDNSILWQANARGVDLNHNYDAGFNKGKEMEREYGIFGPGPTRYGGEYAFSEKETSALRDLTVQEKFDMALCYHSQGEVIYYRYEDKGFLEMAKKFAELTGYQVDETEGIASYRGYKDWFLQEFNKPAFTIEVGLGKNPLQYDQLDGIWEKNKRLFHYIGEIKL